MGNARPPAYRRATYLNAPPTGTTPIHQRSRLPRRDERARSRRHESAPLRRRTQQQIRNPRPSLPENSNSRLAPHATNEAKPRKNVTSGSSKHRARRRASRPVWRSCSGPQANCDSSPGIATKQATNGRGCRGARPVLPALHGMFIVACELLAARSAPDDGAGDVGRIGEVPANDSVLRE
jgi:hypothetical protein